jgi:hypothetical protein
MRDLVLGLILALLSWLERRSGAAVDASEDRPRLRRAGARLREWLREDGPRLGK